jgi:hypothetical protein
VTILGVTLYEGPSVLDAGPIIAIATFNSQNRKTGHMIQTWIMRQDQSPLDASRTGADSSVCGTCPRRHHLNGDCYVVLAQAPQSVWRSSQRGIYPSFIEGVHSRHFIGRSLRLGSYGDPAAVPYENWLPVVSLVKAHTGYTHAVAHPRFDRRITEFCMVSADTAPQAERLRAEGYSTFRVRRPGEPLQPDELECRYVTDDLPCVACRLCSGNGAANISITAHGSFIRTTEAA